MLLGKSKTKNNCRNRGKYQPNIEAAGKICCSYLVKKEKRQADIKDQRVALLKGLKEEQLMELTRELPLTDGADLVAKTLKNLGYKLGILSGGFRFVGEYLKDRLNFDYVYANDLDIEDGVVTGRVVGDIVDGEMKATLLRKLAEKENIALAQTIAVGDGANDLPMISLAGLGVAFNAKPIVRQETSNAISSVGLDGLLYLIGIHDREITEEVSQN